MEKADSSTVSVIHLLKCSPNIPNLNRLGPGQPEIRITGHLKINAALLL